jgi:hypothetical protein
LREFERSYVAGALAFDKRLAGIGREALRKAIVAGSRLAETSPEALPLLEGLRRKAKLRAGDSIPNSDRPEFLVMRDPSGRTK